MTTPNLVGNPNPIFKRKVEKCVLPSHLTTHFWPSKCCNWAWSVKFKVVHRQISFRDIFESFNSDIGVKSYDWYTRAIWPYQILWKKEIQILNGGQKPYYFSFAYIRSFMPPFLSIHQKSLLIIYKKSLLRHPFSIFLTRWIGALSNYFFWTSPH